MSYQEPGRTPVSPLAFKTLSKAGRLKRSHSTSSLYINSTIIRPITLELISSVSTMLHCQIMRDIDTPAKRRNMLPYFSEETYTGVSVTQLPSVRYIYSWLKEMFKIGQFETECIVIALVYINRLIGITGLSLMPSNWKPVTISALCMAQKVWDDTPLINADFAVLYPVLNARQINYLERQFLDLLEFKLTISASLYAQYYFELRSIYEDSSPPTKIHLSNSAKKVARCSALVATYQKMRANKLTHSMTSEDICPRVSRFVIS
jgi:hypothetical protein